MSCTVKCNRCGRTAFARVLEDDYSTNSFVHDEPDWSDEEWLSVLIEGRLYWFEVDDPECLLFLGGPCQHEDTKVIDSEWDD